MKRLDADVHARPLTHFVCPRRESAGDSSSSDPRARLDDPVLYTFGVQLYGQFVVNGFTIDGQCVGWPSCRWP